MWTGFIFSRACGQLSWVEVSLMTSESDSIPSGHFWLLKQSQVGPLSSVMFVSKHQFQQIQRSLSPLPPQYDMGYNGGSRPWDRGGGQSPAFLINGGKVGKKEADILHGPGLGWDFLTGHNHWSICLQIWEGWVGAPTALCLGHHSTPCQTSKALTPQQNMQGPLQLDSKLFFQPQLLPLHFRNPTSSSRRSLSVCPRCHPLSYVLACALASPTPILDCPSPST